MLIELEYAYLPFHLEHVYSPYFAQWCWHAVRLQSHPSLRRRTDNKIRHFELMTQPQSLGNQPLRSSIFLKELGGLSNRLLDSTFWFGCYGWEVWVAAATMSLVHETPGRIHAYRIQNFFFDGARMNRLCRSASLFSSCLFHFFRRKKIFSLIWEQIYS